MCVPAAAALGAASTIVGGIAATQQASTQAKIAKREGVLKNVEAVQEQSKITHERRSIEGKQQVAAAASGRAYSGSALDVGFASDRNAELDILSAAYGGILGSQNAKFQAKQAKAGGQAALFGSFLGAGTTLLTG